MAPEVVNGFCDLVMKFVGRRWLLVFCYVVVR